MPTCDFGERKPHHAATSDDYSIEGRVPDSLSTAELAEVVELLRRGSAVDPKFAADEIPKATSVVLVMKDKRIVGVGAIKRPRPWYAASVQGKCAVSFDRDMCELGYVAVDESHQGHHLSRRIVSHLLEVFHGELFSTTDDDRMKRTLSHFGFVERGEEWKGKRKLLSLWMLHRS